MTIGDVRLRQMSRALLAVVGAVLGFKAMKTPGVEYAGVVESVGDGVTGFAEGDAVAGTATGLSRGANAEYIVVPEKAKMAVIAKRPKALGAREAVASIVGNMTALQLLRKAGLRKDDRVLIYGASGHVGTGAVQIAKHSGAHVTGVASGRNEELVRSLGADVTIDYTTTDFRQSGKQYDLIFDAVGKLKKRSVGARLAEGGRWATVAALTSEKVEELSEVLEMTAAGALKPVIDREISLEEVPDAHRYIETGRKRGSVVVRI